MLLISGVLQCPELQDIANGAVSYTSREQGATATYSCSGDFTLQGTKTRTCGQNGQWSGQEPRCKHSICKFTKVITSNLLL